MSLTKKSDDLAEHYSEWKGKDRNPFLDSGNATVRTSAVLWTNGAS